MERVAAPTLVEREIALAPEASEISPFVGPQLPPKETPPITPGGGEEV